MTQPPARELWYSVRKMETRRTVFIKWLTSVIHSDSV
jgi:hypothetical protein